jgi:hypothetical protein
VSNYDDDDDDEEEEEDDLFQFSYAKCYGGR